MMNFRRIRLASGSQLLERRVCTTAAARASAGCYFPTFKAHISREEMDAYRERNKRTLFHKLWNVSRSGCTVEATINKFISDEEKKPHKKLRVSITKADLLRWAKHFYKEGKHQHALEIFEWMEERKKMSFTGSQLALYVDLIAKTKGLTAAYNYFNKVDPNFNQMDSNAKNRPAFQKLRDLFHRSSENSPICLTNLVAHFGN